MGKTSEEDEESTYHSVYTTPYEIANLVIMSRTEDCIFMKQPLSVVTLSSLPRFLSHSLPFVLHSRFSPAVIAIVTRKCLRRV